ncbi:MAG: hypothetical protein ACYC0V_00515 [Armatimonadota bacterium]
MLTQTSIPHDDCRYSKGIFKDMELPNCLEMDDCGCGRWDEGEPIWVGISKSLWKSSSDTKLQLRIHMEPQFDRITEKLVIKIHYEIDPYMTDTEADNKLNEAEMELFLKGQKQFLNYVWAHTGDILRIGSGWRKVGGKQIPLKPDTKVSDLRSTLAKHIEKIAEIIDGYF